MNPEKPHMAIINISFLIYEMDSMGNPNGLMVGRHAVMNSGAKPKTLKIVGESYEECITKLKEKLSEFV